MSAALQIQNLSKTYAGSKQPALDNLSLSVSEGEVYGFLGPNGAGKSTTIRTLLNFIQPSGGSATILGLDSVQDSVDIRKDTGYLSGDVALYPKVTGAQLFEYLGILQGGVDKTYLDNLVERFEAQIHKPISSLSKGNRQKIGLIQALMHKPKMLVLDEPTSGLDPLMQERFYEVIAEAKSDGSAIFLSSHSLPEAQHLCDRVGIIRAGQLVREATVAELTADVRPIFAVVFKKKPAKAVLAKESAIEVLSIHGASARLRTSSSIQAALKSLSKFDIVSMTVETDQLEDEFMSYYESEEQSA
ncbi:ABC transporter ATP-binding protein [Candidatus Saccharibacteria bacterium]|nr:ABC transporter ATP-binding protein [Candidatus Saccharibacteria bacterium]